MTKITLLVTTELCIVSLAFPPAENHTRDTAMPPSQSCPLLPWLA